MAEAPRSGIRLDEKLKLFEELWTPKVIAALNDYQIKLVKVQGEFVWHQHDATDELFLCLRGALEIELRDGTISLQAGELFVVPKGVEHRPRAEQECHVMLIEPQGVVNTGAVASDLTAPGDAWI